MRAFRRLALRYHPDKNRERPDAARERFIAVNAAFQLLSSAGH